MSKYEKLWMYFKTQASPKITLTYAEIEELAGVPLDHSFLTYKKELLAFNSIWLTLQSKLFICFKKGFLKCFLKVKRPIA